MNQGESGFLLLIASFEAKGRGRLFIKCGCSSVPESAAAVAFRVTVGAGTDAEKSKVLRPHQFLGGALEKPYSFHIISYIFNCIHILYYIIVYIL